MALPLAGLDSIAPDLVIVRASYCGRALSFWVPTAIFVLALALRLGFLAIHSIPLQSDEIDYDQLGWSIASTGTYSTDGHPTAYRPVGYPAFIASIYSAVGRNPQAVRLAQAVLDSGTAVIIFLLFA